MNILKKVNFYSIEFINEKSGGKNITLYPKEIFN